MLKPEILVKNKKFNQLLQFCLEENLNFYIEKTFENVFKCWIEDRRVYRRLSFLVREEKSIFFIYFFIEEELYEKTKLFTKENFKFMRVDEQYIFILRKDGADLLEEF